MNMLRWKDRFPEIKRRIEASHDDAFKNKLFIDGTLITKDNRDVYVGGYDSALEAKATYYPDMRMRETGRPERILLPNSSRIKVKEDNYGLEQTADGLEGKILLTNEKPLIVKMELMTNHLQDESQMYSAWQTRNAPEEPRQPMIKRIIEEIGLPLHEGFTMEERKGYRRKDVIAILEWMKDNLSYGTDQTDYRYFGDRPKGLCEEFCRLFSMIVDYTGGMTIMDPVISLNLPLEGYPYFSSTTGVGGRHKLIRMYLEGTAELVDPTIYATTYQNPDIPEGKESRALSQEIRHYHFLYVLPTQALMIDRGTARRIDKHHKYPTNVQQALKRIAKFMWWEGHQSIHPIIDRTSLKVIR
ncbi:MAG: hypothetical protein GXP63_05650 [DPANN group archaeon]|nr:hypothetical protein [DPANN group archaeon]